MKVTGFSFIKDAIIYDYPIVEAIKSILPICDEFVVAVGKSNDKTFDLIHQIDPKKIKIVETVWNEELRKGGEVLAVETDKAFKAISKDSDWAFYIQGDEVVHEKYLKTIQKAMVEKKDEKKIDGLLFKYLHFYGSYDYVGIASNWYKNEIRVVKNDPSIYSYKDAQGFRKEPSEKLNVFPIDAYMYHYGWVKDPKAMQKKQENFNKYWHDDQWIDQNVRKANEFNYEEYLNVLSRFQGEHPEVMKSRINEKNWTFDYDISINNLTFKDKIKGFLNDKLGIDVGYKNYIITKV